MRDFIGNIFEFDFEIVDIRAHPFEIFVFIRGVHDDEEIFAAFFIHQHVVHGAAAGIAHQRIAYPARVHHGKIVRKHAVERLDGVLSFQREFAHVRNVEKSRRVADGVMLRNDAFRITHGQFVPREIHHNSALFEVFKVKRCAFGHKRILRMACLNL